MGCSGNKIQKNQQNNIPVAILSEPSITDDMKTPKQKLDYILSQPIQEYLKNKRQNYEQLINNLVQQMKIQKNEFQFYDQHLVENYRNLIQQHYPQKELIQFSVDFLSQELQQFVSLEQQFSEADVQLQLKTFKFLIDLYLILTILKQDDQKEQQWLSDYLKKYDEQGHKQTSQNEENKELFLKQIQISLKESVNQSIQRIQQHLRQEQLLKIKQSQDQVMSIMEQHQTEILIHYPKEQNQKYTIPI